MKSNYDTGDYTEAQSNTFDHDSIHGQIYSECYITRECFQHIELTEGDVYLKSVHPSIPGQRLVFGPPQKLSPFELQHLDNFRQHFSFRGQQIPPNYDDESGMFLRYLQCEKFDYEKGMMAVFEHRDWMRTTFPMDPELPSSQGWWRIANLGFLYVAKRDKKGRPVIVLNVERLVAHDNCEIEDLNSFCNYFFTFCIEKLMVPGLIESWIMIVDLNNVGATSVPVSKVKGIIANGSKFFRGRMYKQFTINASWLVRKAFNGLTSFLDEFTQQKLTMLSDCKELLQYVKPECLETKYGGTMPEIGSGPKPADGYVYFPPNMEIPGEHLMSQRELH